MTKTEIEQKIAVIETTLRLIEKGAEDDKYLETTKSTLEAFREFLKRLLIEGIEE